MRILFLTIFDECGPSSRVRAYQYVSALEKQGYKIDIKPLIPSEYFQYLNKSKSFSNYKKIYFTLLIPIILLIKRVFDVLSARFYDVVYLQKDTMIAPLFFLLRLVNPNIVFDLDDALYAKHPTLDESDIFKTKLNNLRKRNLNTVLKKAKLITVSVEPLAEYALQFNRKVKIIKGPIDCNYYNRSKYIKKNNQFIIGWIGSPATTGFLKDIIYPLEKFLNTYSDVLIKFVGAKEFPIDRTLPIKFIDWSLETEIEELQSFDVGIMPVKDDEFSRGKGGYKILQYLSMEIPVVCNPIGINNELVIHGKNGFHVQRLDDWAKFFKILADNADLRLTMGKCGRKLVEDKFSLDIAIKEMDNLFRRLKNKNFA
jgi:glycosyltransferase involved in cell wall biosynthesis